MVIAATALPKLYDFANPASAGFTDTTGRTSVSPALVNGERTAIFIVDGQSVGGDHCQGLVQPTSPKVQCVCVMGDKLLYQLVEPMLGPTFTINGYVGWSNGYGSLWGKVGQLLIDGNALDRVIFCNVSYGGMTAFDFSPAGQLGHRVPLAFNTLNSLGIKPWQVTAILSHLGESDGINGTTAANYQLYRTQSMRVARNFGFTGPWLLARSTWAYDFANATIQGAIANLIAGSLGFKTGADSDSFVGATYRYAEIAGPGSMRVHPNLAGLNAIAPDWVTKIRTALGI